MCNEYAREIAIAKLIKEFRAGSANLTKVVSGVFA
jgi:hypothetical protein